MTKKLLLTGASGFVARHAIPALQAEGYVVTGLATNERPAWVASDIAWVKVDLLDARSLAHLPHNWDAVLHLAGETVPSQLSAPQDALRNAAMVLNLMHHINPTRFMLTSSCHVYGPGNGLKQEHDPVAPQGLYGMSKHLAEQAALANGRGFDVIIVRPFNHIGVGMREELMIPQLINRTRQPAEVAAPLQMHGQDSIRDFLDVRDIVSAYIDLLGIDSLPARIFNVCSGTPVSISQLATLAMECAGKSRPLAFGQANSTDDRQSLVGDPGLLKHVTGWQPKYDLRRSLEEILKVYV
jgi:GDP-4-dehydro-6-deoxy-D-mannose reductase